MNSNPSPPRRHQYYFWIILAALSTFFAEVFSGSDMFPFFHPWGIFLVVPLYGLHILLLASLIYRAPRPRFSSLVFAGMLFGLYEAYLTKVLWDPPWGEALIIGGIAPVETLVLVFWWHAWFSFIIPLLVAEKLLTDSNLLGRSLPGKLGTFLNSWKGLALIMVFGGLFQSINSPSPGQSLLSGFSTTGVLALLVLLWRRMTRGSQYSLSELLPSRRQFRFLLIPTGLMYLGMGIIIRPEAFPGLQGHLLIWLLYGGTLYLLGRSLRNPQYTPNPAQQISPAWKDARWLLLAGLFPLSAVLGELLLAPFSTPLALFFWFSGILFGVVMFITALRQTIFSKGSQTYVQ